MRSNVQRIIIFANGELPNLNKARALLREEDYIMCADGGTRHALALDLKPDLIIGDMDSAGKRELQEFRQADVPIELFPHDKNETDLELALHRAMELNPEQILIVGALGGRLDQTLANIALLTNIRLSKFDIRLDDGVEELVFCRDQTHVYGRNGDLVSLLPWGGVVSGVHTTNLKWALKKETLYPDKTRGISNQMTSDTATISIGAGLLVVIHRRT